MKNLWILVLLAVIMLAGALDAKASVIAEETVKQVIEKLHQKHGEAAAFRIDRGVRQVASFWTKEDGTTAEFETFCQENFVADDKALEQLFDKISRNFETIFGHNNKMLLDLRMALDLNIGEIEPIDLMFGSFDPSAHLVTDLFKNKIAFYIILNFPFYSLQEKSFLGATWTRKEWAYARVGDLFTARIPAEFLQKVTEVSTAVDAYIAEYNIYAGNLLDSDGKTYFAKDLKLISHWGLRDELKSHYGKQDGLGKQRIIYEAMQRIIRQELPEMVINQDDCQWNPYENKLYRAGQEVKFNREPDTRYLNLLKSFHALRACDPYSPQYPTYIKRKFEQEMELPQEQVEELFVKYLSSPLVKQVGALIASRLGRDLEPFDIWYDGFKARSSISDTELSQATRQKYPSKEAFAKDMVNLLVKLGFTLDKAQFIAARIEVDAARGAGHAWGAEMKSEKAHLRTRLTKDGMDYKGYNIASHELGHNVEQTITLQNVDYYMLRGVPNTAFTEAWAFAFQKQDLELLGIKERSPDKHHLYVLDHFWGTYEIMGVSLVDMRVWKWLYENPQATPEQLRIKVIELATHVWNQFYAPVFGGKDQPILGIYSHMIAYPLYLSAYPIGHLIELQMAQYVAGKSLGVEMERMCVQGRLIPQLWMKGAVGREISNEATLEAVAEALKHIK